MLEEILLYFQDSFRQILIFVLIIIATFLVASITKQVVKKRFNRSSRRLKIDPTNFAFLRHAISGIIYILGFSIAIYSIPQLRTLSISLLAGAGVLAVIIGFASQQAFSNIVSGIFLVIFKPFRVGDRIAILAENIQGTVEDINLRHTTIKTFENKRIIIPNSVISQDRIENANMSEEQTCRFVDFGISYESNIDKAFFIMADTAMKHPLCIDHRDAEEKERGEPQVLVKVVGFGDSSVNLRAYVWASNPREAWHLGTDLNKTIKERFNAEGIDIPYPHRTVIQKK